MSKRAVNNILLEGGLNLPISGHGEIGFSYARQWTSGFLDEGRLASQEEMRSMTSGKV
jgi:hypothetical protein